MQRIRKGDRVIVTTGRDKGRQGTVIRVIENDHVVVENVNMVKKHQKPNPQAGVPGGIVQKEAAIHISNVALFNPVTKKADRVAFRKMDDGRKVRVFKSNREVVDA
ncbi:MAG TPA: 50S ribosomal protein L24 [Steroidobacteraceae bacterium]|nr:50S ribosomal protein L24 [Steroidobacteraceae bacterium]